MAVYTKEVKMKKYQIIAEHQDGTKHTILLCPATKKLKDVLKEASKVINLPISEELREGDDIVIITPKGEKISGPVYFGESETPHWIGSEGLDFHQELKCFCGDQNAN